MKGYGIHTGPMVTLDDMMVLGPQGDDVFKGSHWKTHNWDREEIF